MMFNMDGFEFCKKMCISYIDIFVIMLIVKDVLVDKLCGFEVGIDDYVIKFFELEELIF